MNRSMAGRIGCVLALLAVLCVMTVFLFPVLEGPYSVVHGPVTALQSARAAAVLRLALIEAGLNVVKSCTAFMMALVLIFWGMGASPEFRVEQLPYGGNSLLRC